MEYIINAPVTAASAGLVYGVITIESPELAGAASPGQFLHIRCEGYQLRRPISIAGVAGDRLTVVFEIKGKGTRWLSRRKAGDVLNVLGPLGHGFPEARGKVLLVGGGVGVPPLVMLARKLREQGKDVTAVLGFNTMEEVFGQAAFEIMGVNTIVTTADGTFGTKGFVTDAMPEDYSYFYTCGPEPMLKAVYRKTKTSGQFSFEERMGCGFGACMGCSCKTITGNKRICREGPVLEKEEILSWAD